MKYLKKFNETSKSNVSVHNTQIKEIGEMNIPDPEHGDLKLSVFPFENNGEWISLPEGFKPWEESLNKVMESVPLQEGANTHYVTIDSKFFTKDEFLRREGVHADGNFCVDPKFTFGRMYEKEEMKKSWGGISTWGGINLKPVNNPDLKEMEKDVDIKATWGGVTTWGGVSLKESHYEAKPDNSHVNMDWVLPYDVMIPFGDYMSESKGGIFAVSTEQGCQGWQGQFVGEVLSEGNYEGMTDQLTDDKKVVFNENKLYFMTSNCPHETLLIGKGKRRTFMRVTLNHEYLNEQILNK